MVECEIAGDVRQFITQNVQNTPQPTSQESQTYIFLNTGSSTMATVVTTSLLETTAPVKSTEAVYGIDRFYLEIENVRASENENHEINNQATEPPVQKTDNGDYVSSSPSQSTDEQRYVKNISVQNVKFIAGSKSK